MKVSFKIIALVALSAVLLALYWNHFDNGFHFDDAHTILKNTFVQDIDNIPLFFTKGAETFSSLPANQMYRPMVTTTLAIDYFLAGGYNPFYFHLSNFIFFLLILLLGYILLEHLAFKLSNDKKKSFIFSFGVTVFWALHTSNAETVNYIIARSDIHSTFWLLLALLIHIKMPTLRKFGVDLIAICIGILFKSTALMYWPILLVYYLFIVDQRFSFRIGIKEIILSIKKSLLKTLPALIISIAAGYFTLVYMKASTFNPSNFTTLEYLRTQPWVFTHYLVSYIFPVHLSADTDWTILPGLTDDRFIVGMGVLISYLVLMFYLLRNQKTRIASFGLAWFLIALLPTSSIIPLAEVLNDHRVFFPYIGLHIALLNFSYLFINKVFLDEKKRNSHISIGLVILLIFSLHAYGTVQRNKVWHDSESLWLDVTIKSPNNGRGLMNYGLAKMGNGEYDQALQYFNKALVISPNYSYLHTNLGIIHGVLSNDEKAIYHFERSLKLRPDFHEGHFYYSQYLYKKLEFAKTEEHLLKAIQLSPFYDQAIAALIDFYRQSNQMNKLSDFLKSYKKSYPHRSKIPLLNTNIEQSNDMTNEIKSRIGLMISESLREYQSGNYLKCIEICKSILVLDSLSAEAYNNICSAYNALEQYEKAEQFCLKAINIKPDLKIAKNNLNYSRSMQLK